MKIRTKQVLVFFLCAACLGGCGFKEALPEGGQKTETEEKAGKMKTQTEKERAGQKESAEVLDCLFPNVQGAWVGDVMAQVDEDGVHFNYLYETDHNAVGYHPIHRFTTTDFCSYLDEGEIIPFASELEAPDLAVGTGCFFVDMKGIYQCFYTGHNDKAADLGIDKECVMHAVSVDNVGWEKQPEDTFYAPKGYSTDDFRDPMAFWNEDEGCYWMLVGAKKAGSEGSSILKYKSKDLKTWEFQEPFYENEELYFMECPDVFQMGDWYYLIFSWNNVTYYRMAKSMEGPWQQPKIDTFDGNAFYAAKTFEYNGTRYLAGFIDRKQMGNDKLQYTWAGSMCVYELEQKMDGTLGVKMPHQYEETYFQNRTGLYDGPFEVSKSTVLGELPQSMMLTASVKFTNEAGKAGFFFGAENEEDGYSVLLDQEEGCISYDAYPNRQAFIFEVGKTYEVKLVVENEIVVLYVDDTKAFSNRIYQAIGNQWGIAIQDGTAEFSEIKVTYK